MRIFLLALKEKGFCDDDDDDDDDKKKITMAA